MPAPVPHHRALGIHPGAFVQPTEPSTTDVQDGVFWLDTSAGPPHQLKRWHAASSAWQPVQMDATGYPFPSGHRIEDYRIGALPDPLDPPVLAAVTRGSTCAVPAGEYWLVYTLGDGLEETLPSPPAAVTTASGQWIDASVPSTLDPGTLPDNVWIKYYVVAPLPSDGLYAGFVDEHYYQAINSNLYAVTHICTALDHSRPLPPSINNTGTAGFRILDPSGAVLLTHDGSTATLFTGSVAVLEAPLPVLARAPATLVGKDPDSGLPSFCPAPPNVALPPTAPVPLTVPSGQAVQARCGASNALTGHLTSVYSRWASELGVITSVVGTIALTAFLINLVDPIYDVALVGASTAGMYQVIRSLIQSLTSAASGTLFDSLTSDETSIIQKACFCALTVSGGIVPITQDAIDAWRAGLPGDLGLPGTLTNELLDTILAYTPLSDWQIASQGAGTSSACDTWTCP